MLSVIQPVISTFYMYERTKIKNDPKPEKFLPTWFLSIFESSKLPKINHVKDWFKIYIVYSASEKASL